MFKPKGRTIAEEQRRLKDDFKTAAQASDSDEGGFVVKGKRKDLSDSEDEAPEVEAEAGRLVTDKELLARFYGDDNQLDRTDRFLRNYILQEGWRGNMKETDPKLDQIDNEDEDREDEFDKFEYAMNFRYEDPNAATITSHARNALKEETLRRQDNTRKLARERK